ncbi:MAG: hypothetical protein AAF635_12025, partial [Cyanobacteria bacterium P01_C01_bin.69]
MFTIFIPRVRLRRHQPFTHAFTLWLSVGLSILLALAPLQPSLAISVADVLNPRQVDGTWVT